MKNSKLFLIIVVAVISTVIISTFFRLMEHPLNIAPMIAITLLSAAYLPKRWMGLVLPLLCWFISDLFVNLYRETPTTGGLAYFFTPTAIGVYTSLIVVFLLGSLLRSGVRVPKLIGITLSSSFVFFLITNSFCFFEGNLYGTGLGGYIDCIVAGIPFYRNSFIGDLVYVSILFGGYYLVNQKSLKPAFV